MAEEKDARARAKIKRNTLRTRRNAHPLNFFDLLIIFLILLVVALFFLGVRLSDIFGGAEEPVGRDCEITYNLTLYNVDAQFAEVIQAENALYDATTGVLLGEVVGQVIQTPHKELAANSGLMGSEFDYNEVPGRVDLTVSIKASAATYTEGRGYAVSGRAIRVGATYALRFPGYTGEGVCVTLREPGTAE